MSGMLADLCSHYYRLTEKVEKRDERYKKLIENDLTFDLNATVSELDKIIDHKLKIDKAYEFYQVAIEKWKETEKKILSILKHFGIRPRWTLTGEIPGELRYWVWYDPKDNVHIMKIEDLELEELDPNCLYLKMADPIDAEEIEDEDEFEREERLQKEQAQADRYEHHNNTRHEQLEKLKHKED